MNKNSRWTENRFEWFQTGDEQKIGLNDFKSGEQNEDTKNWKEKIVDEEKINLNNFKMGYKKSNEYSRWT